VLLAPTLAIAVSVPVSAENVDSPFCKRDLSPVSNTLSQTRTTLNVLAKMTGEERCEAYRVSCSLLSRRAPSLPPATPALIATRRSRDLIGLSNRSTAASPTVADETTVRMALHGVIALE
jgi:hypothetical protein